MVNQGRIFVVEDEENLNHNIINSLRKEGYIVDGARSDVEAVRTLWSEAYDVVICALKTPEADSFDLLSWLYTYRSNTRVIVLGTSMSTDVQAFEHGAVSYLEKPLDLHLLKEELRHLLNQTGFTANLDSFDLLDVIQIVTMSRKGIALLVSTGVEEHGTLCFQNGELIWAEYGLLHGEEAFFALAAHKNGTVVHQPWNEQVTPNVTQPLSRLIFQALQYRMKYAPSGEQEDAPCVPPSSEQEDDSLFGVLTEFEASNEQEDDRPFGVLTEFEASNEQEDDRPFGVLTEFEAPQEQHSPPEFVAQPEAVLTEFEASSEQEDDRPFVVLTEFEAPEEQHSPSAPIAQPEAVTNEDESSEEWWQDTWKFPAISKQAAKGVPAPASQRTDLPLWLTDQPTFIEIPAIQPSSLSSTKIPVVPVLDPKPAEWQPPVALPPLYPVNKTTGPITNGETSWIAPSEWQVPDWETPSRSELLLTMTDDMVSPLNRFLEDRLTTTTRHNYNYTALVSALETLGYSIASGFITAAVVSLDGQPIAQVVIDDLDISQICRYFSTILKSVMQSPSQDTWGDYHNTIISNADHHILMRIVGREKSAFQVLITTHEANLTESIEMMENVEAAMSAALTF